MIITVKKEAPQQEIDKLIQGFEKRGLQGFLRRGGSYRLYLQRTKRRRNR